MPVNSFSRSWPPHRMAGAGQRHHQGVRAAQDPTGERRARVGQQQASKDLHSLRRSHASKCRDALNSGAQGFTMYTVADNLGHAKGGLGLSMTSHYAGKESLEAKAKAVEAVRLPC
jgi:hypothetical protein